MKKLICLILIVATLTLTSCSHFGTTMPDWGRGYIKAFENDTWLIIEHMLINKEEGTVTRLEADFDKELPEGIWFFYVYEPYVYKCEFEEEHFNVYTYLLSRENSFNEVLYYECMLTYGYDGKEIEREYIGDPLREEEMKRVYKNNPSNVKAFSYEADTLGVHSTGKNDTKEKEAILSYAEELYEAQFDSYSTVVGLAKPIGDMTWFSVTVSVYSHYNSGEPLFQGINKSEIKSYNAETKEFETVYKYKKEDKQIIDFDENGFYVIDSKGKLSYVDFKTEEATLIHDFSERVYSFDVTDDYICAVHGRVGSNYFVYKKGGSVLANDEH